MREKVVFFIPLIAILGILTSIGLPINASTNDPEEEAEEAAEEGETTVVSHFLAMLSLLR